MRKNNTNELFFPQKSLFWTNNLQYFLSCLWACCFATKSYYRISLACKEATESSKYQILSPHLKYLGQIFTHYSSTAFKFLFLLRNASLSYKAFELTAKLV